MSNTAGKAPQKKKTGRNIGRPLKLTPALSKKICMYIAAGNYVDVAAMACGVNRERIREWLKRGAKGEEPFASFLTRMDEAVATAETVQLGLIEQAAKNGIWQAAAWNLERKHPGRWGMRRLTDEAREERELRMRKLRAEAEIAEKQARGELEYGSRVIDHQQAVLIMRDVFNGAGALEAHTEGGSDGPKEQGPADGAERE